MKATIAALAYLGLLVSPLLGAVCRPVRCSWSAPEFQPSAFVAEVWALPCPTFSASAPGVAGTYPVTLTITCVYLPTQSTTTTRMVDVVGGFRDGFEGGSTAAWNWRYP